jgi:phosphatidylglycerophosphate synthase
MISIKDVYDSLPENKNKNDSVFDRYFMRPLSIPASIPFIKHNMSPNTVSCISLAVAVLGIITTVKSYIYGGIVLLIWFILDNVDGNIARYKKDFTDYGDFIDSASSFFIILSILPAMGWSVSRGVEPIDKALILKYYTAQL